MGQCRVILPRERAMRNRAGEFAMTRHGFAVALTACVILAVALTPEPVSGQTSGVNRAAGAAAARATAGSPPRTPDGRPDLQGTWDFRTLTPLERPDNFSGKDVLTAEEAVQ